MSTAAEARFRIDKPNSQPRSVKVIALDARAEPAMASLAQHDWNGATFFRAGELTDAPERLAEEIDRADLVVMLATAGQSPDVEAIGRACSGRRITTTGLVLGSNQVSDEELSRTLSRLRPWALMLVIANSLDYVEDMLRALRA